MEPQASSLSVNKTAPDSSVEFKIIVLGDFGAGKTCLVNRIHKNRFTDISNVTNGVDICKKTVLLEDGQTVRINIWDTAGQEQFRSLTSSYFRNVDGIIFVYDVTNDQSLCSIKGWLGELAFYIKDTCSIVKVLVGTKSDLASKTTDPNIVKAQFSSSMHRLYEVSSKSGENVEEMFTAMCKTLLTMRANSALPRSGSQGSSQPGDQLAPERTTCAC